MLVNKIVCAHCNASMTSKAGVPAGTTIACPKCKKKFTVEAPAEKEVVEDFEVIEEEAPKKKPAPKPAAPVKNAFADLGGDEKPIKKKPPRDEDDEDRPKKKSRIRDEDEDDDDRPRKKSRARDEDEDDDDRPRKKKKKQNTSTYTQLKENIWVRAALLGVLLIGLGVAIWLRWGRDRPTESSPEATSNSESGKNDPKDSLPQADKSKPINTNLTPEEKRNLPPEYDERLFGTWKGKAADGDVIRLTYESGGTYKLDMTSPTGKGSGNGKWRLNRNRASTIPNEVLLEFGGTTTTVIIVDERHIEQQFTIPSTGKLARVTLERE